jgi:hypothetical protein
MKHANYFFNSLAFAIVCQIFFFGFDYTCPQAFALFGFLALGLGFSYLPRKAKAPVRFAVFYVARIARSVMWWVETPTFKKWNNFRRDLTIICWVALFAVSLHFIYIGFVFFLLRYTWLNTKQNPETI